MQGETVTLQTWDDISTYVEAVRNGLHAEAAQQAVDAWTEQYRQHIQALAERVMG